MSTSPEEIMLSLVAGVSSGEAIRRGWMRELSRQLGASCALSYGLGYEAGTEMLYCSDVFCEGDADWIAYVEGTLPGTGFVELCSYLEDCAPANHFELRRHRKFMPSAMSRLWEQHSLAEALSINVVDLHGRFAGHLSLFWRMGDEPPDVDRSSSKRLRDWEKASCELFLATHGKLVQGPKRRGAVLYRHDGRPWMQSRLPDEWAMSSYSESLRLALERFASSDDKEAVLFRHGCRINLSVLSGEGDEGTLVVAEPLHIPEVSELFMLRPLQRQIAAHLARGDTLDEIGAALDRSVGTVKSHQKRLYSKLNVSSRSELAALYERALDWCPAHLDQSLH